MLYEVITIRDEHMIANGCFPEVEGSGGIRTVDSPIQIGVADLVRSVALRLGTEPEWASYNFV